MKIIKEPMLNKKPAVNLPKHVEKAADKISSLNETDESLDKPSRFDSVDFENSNSTENQADKLARRKKERAENARRKAEENKKAAAQMQEELKSAKESAEAEAKAMQEKFKCLEVFRRISSGAKVPRKDEQKLMEFDHKLYELAKQLAAMKQERSKKVYDSLWEDEEEQGSLEEESSIEARDTAASSFTVQETEAVAEAPPSVDTD